MYEREVGKLVYRHPEGTRFSPGEHAIKVVVRDAVGNATTRSWSFTITRQ